MSRILITGSADGLGLMAAQLLISQGHEVVLHARNQVRVADARAAAPGAPDDLGQAHLTQVWLAVSDDPAATVSGAYFYTRPGAPRTLPSPTPTCRRACSRPAPN
jgi:NAD(P)-dependent dehydrogenase (short-subunit alcohol dehydrogenase family)